MEKGKLTCAGLPGT